MKRLRKIVTCFIAMMFIVPFNAKPVDASNFCISCYASTLTIGYGSSVIGQIRHYAAGYNFLYIKSSGYYNEQGNYLYSISGYTILQVLYITSTGVSSILISKDDVYFPNSSGSELLSYGYLGEADRYYSFSTKVNGKSYYGVQSNSMRMYSMKENEFIMSVGNVEK